MTESSGGDLRSRPHLATKPPVAVNSPVRWRRVAILGVGLLGGSLGKALRCRGLAEEVTGFVRREETARAAMKAGAVDRAGRELASVVAGADLVVLCTPVARMAPLVAELTDALAPGATVTDVGSVKAAVVSAAEDVVARAGGCFVGSHPMAGSERTGVEAAREDLFSGAVVVVTPTDRSDAAAVVRVHELWRSVGARVISLDPERHDTLVARSSHLPHLVAASLASYILGADPAPEQGALCATGFRDTTRVASGSPEMWRDIALANREAILSALDGFGMSLARLRRAIEDSDAEAVERYLVEAKARRDGWTGGGSRGSDE